MNAISRALTLLLPLLLTTTALPVAANESPERGERLHLRIDDRLRVSDPKQTVETLKHPAWRSYIPYHGQELFGPGMFQYLADGKENLLDLAKDFGLGYNSVEMANPGLDLLGTSGIGLVRLPLATIVPAAAREVGVTVNLPEMRMYHHKKDGTMRIYPIGVGQEGFLTPQGRTTIQSKKANPTWVVPASIRKEDPTLPPVVPPGPDNPMGSHALYLQGPPPGGFRIHGTNKEWGIGMRVSHGCIRLYKADIPQIFDHAGVGEQVTILYEPIKTGWVGDDLYLEVYPVLEEAVDRMDLRKMAPEVLQRALARRPGGKEGGGKVAVDWELVNRMVAAPDGVPRPVATVLPDLAGSVARIREHWRMVE